MMVIGYLVFGNVLYIEGQMQQNCQRFSSLVSNLILGHALYETVDRTAPKLRSTISVKWSLLRYMY